MKKSKQFLLTLLTTSIAVPVYAQAPEAGGEATTADVQPEAVIEEQAAEVEPDSNREEKLASDVESEAAAEPSESPASTLKPLPADVVSGFQARLDEISSLQALVADLDRRRLAVEGVRADVFSRRMDDVWSTLFESALGLARDVVQQRDAGFDVSYALDRLVRDLEGFPDQAIAAMDRISSGVSLPSSDMSAAELVVSDRKLLVAVERFDRVLNSLFLYIGVAEALGVDAADVREFLVKRLADSVASRSTYLALAIEDVGIVRGAAAVLPNDATLPAQVLAA